jgi:hypothetical protein
MEQIPFKFLADLMLQQELVNHTRQLFILNQIIVDRICKKK